MPDDMRIGVSISYELWTYQHDQQVLIAARFESKQKALAFAEVKLREYSSVQLVEAKTVRSLKELKMKTETDFEFVHTLRSTFSLTTEQRAKCEVCFLLQFSEVRYLELVQQIAMYNLQYFRWYAYEDGVKKELIGKVYVPKMRSMLVDTKATAQATVGVSIRKRNGVVYVLIAPLYGTFKSHSITEVRWSLDQVLSNCFLGAVSSE